MSTSAPTVTAPNAPNARIAIIDTLWNREIVAALTQGAVDTLLAHEVKQENIHIVSVPGAVELTYAAARLMATGKYDAIILNGCVVRGGTPHFDYVCQSVTQGMTQLNLLGEIPVIFGVLTVDNEQQALDRAGGCLGNKGSECAEAALHMLAL
ncbi:MAG: 6,7-dimethyl-8-ribityllumazine synthase [Bacteroidales bacterium]|nr:6,7-dimethyl-8-ribityllumazine synthase [Bacteroidales bacterium]